MGLEAVAVTPPSQPLFLLALLWQQLEVGGEKVTPLGNQTSQVIAMLKRQELSIRAISGLTGYDRKTIRKYLIQPESTPVYGPRPAKSSKLDAFKGYLSERLKAGVWNAQVLLRELRARGYPGGYTILKDWLQPQRESACTVAVRRFETPPGKQAQVDWGHLGTIEMDGQQRALNGLSRVG